MLPGYYFDQQVSGAITCGLRLRGVIVLTAYEDGSALLEDEKILLRATALGRVLFTQDEDLLALAPSLPGRREIFYWSGLRSSDAGLRRSLHQ